MIEEYKPVTYSFKQIKNLFIFLNIFNLLNILQFNIKQ